MNAAIDQIIFEASAMGGTALAFFIPYVGVDDAGREQYGANCARFYPGLLNGAGVECSPVGLQYSAGGVVLFIAVADVDKALSEIWGAASRFEIEDNFWCAAHDGQNWRDLFPVRGVHRTIPAEIVLLPARFYALENELRQLREKQEEMAGQLRERREMLASGRVIDALASEDHDAAAAWVDERLRAVESEMASLKIEALGLKEES